MHERDAAKALVAGLIAQLLPHAGEPDTPETECRRIAAAQALRVVEAMDSSPDALRAVAVVRGWRPPTVSERVALAVEDAQSVLQATSRALARGETESVAAGLVRLGEQLDVLSLAIVER